MKSLFKFIKYDKNLLNKLEFNIKDHFKYKISIEISKGEFNAFTILILVFKCLTLILYLIYIILFYTKGKFNTQNLKENYNQKKKNFIDMMDNYIITAYFTFLILSLSLNILFNINKKRVVKKVIKIIFTFFPILIDFIHYILHLYKFDCTKNILKKNQGIFGFIY